MGQAQPMVLAVRDDGAQLVALSTSAQAVAIVLPDGDYTTTSRLAVGARPGTWQAPDGIATVPLAEGMAEELAALESQYSGLNDNIFGG